MRHCTCAHNTPTTVSVPGTRGAAPWYARVKRLPRCYATGPSNAACAQVQDRLRHTGCNTGMLLPRQPGTAAASGTQAAVPQCRPSSVRSDWQATCQAHPQAAMHAL